jgi:hypothetical protein
MTLPELKDLAYNGDGDDRTIHHTEAAHLVVGWRFINGQTCRPGSRIDLRCEACNSRIVLGPKSVNLIEQGKRAVCRECFCAATGVEEFPRGA